MPSKRDIIERLLNVWEKDEKHDLLQMIWLMLNSISKDIDFESYMIKMDDETFITSLEKFYKI